MVRNLLETGIKSKDNIIKLDKLLGGGIPKGSCVLVTGTTGTSKSTFCAQILDYNSKNKLKCLYITFDQIEKDLIDQMQLFGFKFKNNPYLTVLNIDPSEKDVIKELFQQIEESHFDWIVLDSIASLASSNINNYGKNMNMVQIADSVIPKLQTEESLTREKVRKIIKAFKQKNITALLVNEQPEGSDGLSRDGISDFLADGVIVLYYVGIGGSTFRSLRIRKMRKINHEKDPINFSLTKKGIVLEKQKTLD